jgi:hypothetical protein
VGTGRVMTRAAALTRESKVGFFNPPSTSTTVPQPAAGNSRSPSRHSRTTRPCAGVHIAAGIVLAGLGAVTLFGGSFSTIAAWWAVPFLAVAAGQFLFAARELAIARSASPRT